ncbi:MAG: molecular chaperone TorD family protein [Acidobacteriota bacterium]|nr:molecular chaperone TorD family protein [Acidobacteriota bacterium]
MRNRSQFYSLLARLFRVEVDQDLLNKMMAMNFPSAAGPSELAGGYGRMSAYLAKPGADPLTDLAVDYAHTFLGAGIAQGTVAHPYESVYTSTERLMCQDACDQMQALFLGKGLSCDGSLDMPEDHISFELEYMAHLCADAIPLCKSKDAGICQRSFAEQKQFLRDHLLNWIPEFCSDIKKCAATGFYLGAADMLLGFLHLDESLLENLMAESDEPAA